MAAATQAFQLPSKYVNDLSVSWVSNTTLSVTSGRSRNSTNVQDIVVGSTTIIDAAVNGINGLDTGTFAASTWYYVFSVGSSLNVETPGFLISTSASAPVMPTGRDEFTLIGAWLTDASTHFIKGYYAGNGNVREFYYDDSIKVLNDGTASTLTALDLTTAVPPIQNTPVLIQDEFTPATANDYVSYITGDSSGTVGPRTYGSVAAKMNGGQHWVLSRLASSVAKIKYINSAASCNTDLWVNGFKLFI